jgi:hypothetical protein
MQPVGTWRHAELLPHAQRARVLGIDDRDDLAHLPLHEAELDRGPRRLGRVAPTPRVTREPPPHLDRRQHGRQEHRHAQPAEPQQRRVRVIPQRHRPQPEPALVPLALEPRDQVVAQPPPQDMPTPDPAHHLGIGVDRRELGGVPDAPTAQQQAIRQALGHGQKKTRDRSREALLALAPRGAAVNGRRSRGSGPASC